MAKSIWPLCQWNLHWYFFQFLMKSHKLDPWLKVSKVFLSVNLGIQAHNYGSCSVSVTRLGIISPLWQNLKSCWAINSIILLVCKALNLHWQIYYAIGQIYIVINGQILKNALAISSHWLCFDFLCWQCDQMARLFGHLHYCKFVQRSAIFAKLCLKFCQSLNKPINP